MGLANIFRACVHAVMGVNAKHRENYNKLSQATGLEWSTFIIKGRQKLEIHYHTELENKALASVVVTELNRQAKESGLNKKRHYTVTGTNGGSSTIKREDKHFTADIWYARAASGGNREIFLNAAVIEQEELDQFIADFDAQALQDVIHEELKKQRGLAIKLSPFTNT